MARTLGRAAALVLLVTLPAAAQLREVRPAHTALAFGWSDVTGSGVALAFLQLLPRAPLALGAAAGAGGVGAHSQFYWREPFGPPWRNGPEPITYASIGIARVFRDGLGVARGEWAVVLGSELWPDARPGPFFDVGLGWFGAIGGRTPAGFANGFTARLLLGWAL